MFLQNKEGKTLKTLIKVKTLRVWRKTGDKSGGNYVRLTNGDPKQEVKTRRISKIKKPKCEQDLAGFFFVDEITILCSFKHKGELVENKSTVYAKYSPTYFPNVTVLTIRKLRFKLEIKKIFFTKGQKNQEYSIQILEELIKNMERCGVKHVLVFDETITTLLPCINIKRFDGYISAEAVDIREYRMSCIG